MSFSVEHPAADSAGTGIVEYYLSVRQRTLSLCDTLAPEDTVVQSMADVSPTKWHLAHTTWFFERFVLKSHTQDYREFHPTFDHLFNSYYYSVGQMFTRAHRGLLSRPTLAQVLRYREYVDGQILALLQHGEPSASLRELITLGVNHEQQHQELLLTDIKHVFSLNPLLPVFREAPVWNSASATPLRFIEGPNGIIECGANVADPGFSFDNETPAHQVLVRPHKLASRPVTNSEYLEFVKDGAYEQCSLWLADGWTVLNQEGWRRPFYWSEDLASEFTLNGQVALDPHAPVCHLSLYEADAFARWAGKRLPTEFELELALRQAACDGNLADEDQFHPRAPRLNAPIAVGTSAPSASEPSTGLAQLYGDVWEWTASPYSPYPGFVPLAGSLGEYNGKFMSSQMVLRGGSCATPRSHLRATYRNFFYPDARWQFSGVRLAHDA
ncbi:MAG: ergothioneine biosynthesis protein EgtB [Pseudomonadota bacterium]